MSFGDRALERLNRIVIRALEQAPDLDRRYFERALDLGEEMWMERIEKRGTAVLVVRVGDRELCRVDVLALTDRPRDVQTN
ncbi:MAG: hypothetical protein ACRDIU_06330 [Actinomycetota bacterium]